MEIEFNDSSSSSKGETLSEFTITPNTSVQSTPVQTPNKDKRDEHIIMDVPFPENPIPSGSKDKLTRTSTGKNLELIKPNEQCATPSDSLYFSEMTRTKTTQRLNKNLPKGKQPRKQIATTPLKKLSPKSVMNLRNQTRKAIKAGTKGKQPTVATGGLKKPMRYKPGVVIGKTPPSKKPSPLQEHKMFACRYLIRRGVHRKMVITTVYLTVRCMSLT